MQSEYLFELGGENKELARIEAMELLKTEMYKPEKNFEEGRIATITVSRKLTPATIRRLGMTKRVSRIILSSKEKNIEKAIEKLPRIDIGNNSFAIRRICRNEMAEKEIAVRIGEKISKENRIDLTNPDVKILFYTSSRTIISVFEQDFMTSYKNCLQHHVKYRPYFSPISIHPRIARSMINLSNCKVGDTILDPFCGTGGILVEAADIGMKIKGIDIIGKMVENSNGNLKHFGFEGTIIKGDVEESKNLDSKAIVTDPPYGISSSSGGEEIDKLLQRSIDVFGRTLKKGKRVVIAVSNPELVKTKKLTLLYQFEWYIHKSLTRHILVLEKN